MSAIHIIQSSYSLPSITKRTGRTYDIWFTGFDDDGNEREVIIIVDQEELDHIIRRAKEASEEKPNEELDH